MGRVEAALGWPSRVTGVARILGGVVLFALLHHPVRAVQNVTLAWDKSPDLSAVGYNIYYGAASRTYTNTVNVGNATNRTISGLIEGATYYFAATAYNTAGVESVFSNETGYTVPASNNLPTITLTSPANGASYTAPATVGLAASVTANGHTITKVQFYNGSGLLGEDTSSPYGLTWNSVNAGSYSLTARVLYDTGSTLNSAPAPVVVTGAAGTGTVTFSNSAAITIADVGAGTPYPSTINVAGRGGTITKVTLTLKGLGQTYPDDVDILLVGPGGQKLMLFSDVGGDYDVNNVTVTLADAATAALPDNGPLVAGTFKPTDAAPGEVRDLFPAPAPPGPYATSLAAFNGLAANGTWSLFVNDDGPGDAGTIAGGWSLTITTTGPANTAPTISNLPDQSTTANTATAAIPFTVNDPETPAANLTLSKGSSNLALMPTSNIVFGGSGANRTVTLTPAANQTGSATITVSVSDGTNSVSDSFVLTVNAVSLAPTVALTAPLGGASYPAPATISLAASVTANGHTITKVQFYNGTVLLGEDSASPYSFTWNNVSAGSYSLTARAVYDAGSSVNSSPVSITVTGLPAPWQTADIGSVGVTGSASVSNGVYTVKGAGNVSGRADNFRFLYQTLTGDGEIKVRVNSVANTGTSGRIGVIIRESLTSGSKYAFMGLTPDGTFRWQRRSSTGGSTGATIATVGTPPNAWVRLVRTGSTIYGYRSTDGITWTLVNSRSITMATSIYVGLAVASGNSTTLNLATFTNLTVVP